jgi:hypothetical protein
LVLSSYVERFWLSLPRMFKNCILGTLHRYLCSSNVLA